MSAESHLAKFGVTVQQAEDFINANIRNPGDIFQAAREYGVTTEMLSELSGYSVDDVRGYFDSIEVNSRQLDFTKILINSDLGSLESLISTNQKEGLLSNDSLEKLVSSKIIDPGDYKSFFQPVKSYQDDDGIYDADELGVSSLGNIPATEGSLKSVFYGSLINIFSRLDDAEMNQIKVFPNKESGEYQSLLVNALNSPAEISRNDADLANLVVNETVDTIANYWKGVDPDTNFVDYRTGLFDFGLLGNI
ncbi:hypothetical protein [Nitrosomonas sp.]|uniref:hypothetical protein n=1 Tax=Nitrosomonas sp. TaxID=42353 RepID=UPI001DEE0575|nr:hypothetical protein [Nitrosomonas sp.]MBX3617283.1 hypothetical protein [Nitrosomonas sp.]